MVCTSFRCSFPVAEPWLSRSQAVADPLEAVTPAARRLGILAPWWPAGRDGCDYLHPGEPGAGQALPALL